MNAFQEIMEDAKVEGKRLAAEEACGRMFRAGMSYEEACRYIVSEEFSEEDMKEVWRSLEEENH